MGVRQSKTAEQQKRLLFALLPKHASVEHEISYTEDGLGTRKNKDGSVETVQWGLLMVDKVITSVKTSEFQFRVSKCDKQKRVFAEHGTRLLHTWNEDSLVLKYNGPKFSFTITLRLDDEGTIVGDLTLCELFKSASKSFEPSFPVCLRKTKK